MDPPELGTRRRHHFGKGNRSAHASACATASLATSRLEVEVDATNFSAHRWNPTMARSLGEFPHSRGMSDTSRPESGINAINWSRSSSGMHSLYLCRSDTGSGALSGFLVSSSLHAESATTTNTISTTRPDKGLGFRCRDVDPLVMHLFFVEEAGTRLPTQPQPSDPEDS